MTETRPTRTPSRMEPRLLVVAVIAPLVLAIAGIAVQLAWLPQLPDRIVMHWGLKGPDGFAPFWASPLLLAVVGIGVSVGFGVVLARAAAHRNVVSLGQKIIAVAVLGATTILAVGLTGSLSLQRGLTDAASATGYLPVQIAALASAVVLGLAAWFFLPRASLAVPDSAAAPSMKLGATETAVWVGTAQFGTGIVIALGTAVALVCAAVAYAVAVVGAWPIAVAPVLLALLIWGTATWRVRVDADGLDVRALFGWPRARVRLTEVASAGTSEVQLIGEFGGLGMRFARGHRVGVITRTGQALDVKRHDGSSLVVTVDDAATAAALLDALTAKLAVSGS